LQRKFHDETNPYLSVYHNIRSIYDRYSPHISTALLLEDSHPPNISNIDLVTLLSRNLVDAKQPGELIKAAQFRDLNDFGMKLFKNLLVVQSPATFQFANRINSLNYKNFDFSHPQDDSSSATHAIDYAKLCNNVGDFLVLYDSARHRYMRDSASSLGNRIDTNEVSLPFAEEINHIYMNAFALFYTVRGFEKDSISKINLFANKVIALFQFSRTQDGFMNSEDLQSILMQVASTNPDSLTNEINSFSRFYVFATTLSYARTAQDVKFTLEAFELPRRGPIIKQINRVSWDVESWTGIGYSVGAKTTYLTLDIPFGLDFSFWPGVKSHGNHDDRHSYFSVFLQAVNLGNPFAANFASSKYPVFNSIHFASLLVPGVSLGYGLKTLPLGFRCGVEYNLDLSQKREWMAKAGIVLNIPVVHLDSHN
jgi:hypothetical protein